MGKFEKGSEWRKWDLHVHSPYSVLSNEYPGTTFEEKWNSYLDALEEIEGVSVLGITDYFSIEGYKRLVVDKSSGRLRNIDLILPNVELRLDLSTQQDRPVNLHLIFSPKIISDLENRFFSRLIFKYRGQDYSSVKRDLVNLGKTFSNNDSISEEEALRKGMEQFKVSKDQLIKLIEGDKLLRDNSFVVIADRSGDGASGLRDNSLMAVREELYRFSDAIFSSTPSTCKYFLGEGTDAEDIVRQKYGSLKPCIHGSDAHSPSKICKPDNDRFTWIKADSTFEGLRQIIFEPKDRVYIGNHNPQTTFIRPYFSSLRIDSGAVFDSGLLQFTSNDLSLNPNMVCIIGGRGSGKSVLLSAIRRTFFKASSQNPDDKSDEISTANFHVTFTKTDNTNQEYHIQEDNNLDYLHVSQGEVKHIVQHPDILDKQIKGMLGIVDPGKSIYEIDGINKVISRIIELKNFFQQTTEDGKLLNHPSYQQQEINKYRQLIATITTESNKDLIEKYRTNVSELAQMKSLLGELKTLSCELIEFQSSFNKRINSINEKLGGSATISDLKHDSIVEQIKAATELLENNEKKLTSTNKGIAAQFQKAGIEGDITTLLEKVNQYQDHIETSEKSIKRIKELEEELKGLFDSLKNYSVDIKTRLNNYISQLGASWESLRNGKEGWSQKQQDLSAKLTDGIDVNGLIWFDIDAFYKAVDPSINKSKFRATKDISLEQRVRNFIGVSNKDDYFRLLEGEKIFDVGEKRMSLSEILDEEYFVKDGEKTLLNALFESSQVYKYLKVICELKYKNKKPSQLSVGQRGTLFVCLKLATDTFGQPFVFDQPEDDLDNKFIMHELVPLFRTIKNFRQVIVVTHNANLVVNADAEQVIVAANEGEKVSYMSGSLENSKVVDPSNVGIREDVCDILEGGATAFKNREQKYRISTTT
ncbi:MAG: AAA family ATPase [Pseudobdellovibrionaceae bacterium]|nr:MAG: AAA family ATPase [Pseudobdellovibrionaceae bacterium]